MVNKEILDKKELAGMVGAIRDESLELIDFDQLGQAIDKVQMVTAQSAIIEKELQIIKGDYRRRIVGMLKANMVSRHDEEQACLAARLLSDEDIGAEELVYLYRRTAARFRDNFPASFDYVRIKGNRKAKNDWMEHKI